MTPSEQEAALQRVNAELDATRAQLQAARSQRDRLLERVVAELDKVKADFANACDVGRRQEARADRAEAQRDRLRAACVDAEDLFAFHNGSAEPLRAGGHPVCTINGEDCARVLAALRAALEETK